jgi:hypothetical protein
MKPPPRDEIDKYMATPYVSTLLAYLQFSHLFDLVGNQVHCPYAGVAQIAGVSERKARPPCPNLHIFLIFRTGRQRRRWR